MCNIVPQLVPLVCLHLWIEDQVGMIRGLCEHHEDYEIAGLAR